MIFFPLVCLIVGVLIGTLVGQPVRGEEGKYLAVAVIAGLDTICGGIRSSLEGKFHNDVFITGFLANVLIAFFLAWLGDKIGANIFLVCALIFGSRIFNNLSLIRRFGLSKWQDYRDRKKQEKAQAQQAAAS